ncbi:transcriptional regulation of mitochondrial recombination-domain-containing protein, partial [Chaetomidium leptoderma]
SNKAFRQLAYTGKKLIPAKLRKDYWRPMAVLEFAPGQGAVGRSVFHKLRELKQRHQLEWDDPALLAMTRRARGEALNDQRGNSVADMAAVLAGIGKGNRVRYDGDQEDKVQPEYFYRRGRRFLVNKKGGQQQEETTAAVAVNKEKGVVKEGVVEVVVKKDGDAAEGEGEKIWLHQATVYWANEQDKFYAEQWTENVTHVIGLPEKVKKGKKAAVEEEAEAAAEAPEAAKAE